MVDVSAVICVLSLERAHRCLLLLRNRLQSTTNKQINHPTMRKLPSSSLCLVQITISFSSNIHRRRWRCGPLWHVHGSRGLSRRKTTSTPLLLLRTVTLVTWLWRRRHIECLRVVYGPLLSHMRIIHCLLRRRVQGGLLRSVRSAGGTCEGVVHVRRRRHVRVVRRGG